MQSWDDTTDHDKVEALREEMFQLHAALDALISDLKAMRDVMKARRSVRERAAEGSRISEHFSRTSSRRDNL